MLYGIPKIIVYCCKDTRLLSADKDKESFQKALIPDHRFDSELNDFINTFCAEIECYDQLDLVVREELAQLIQCLTAESLSYKDLLAISQAIINKLEYRNTAIDTTVSAIANQALESPWQKQSVKDQFQSLFAARDHRRVQSSRDVALTVQENLDHFKKF